MKINWKSLVPCILIPEAVGGLAALLANPGMEAFELLDKPPLTPPGWLFPIVWTVLFALMGIACYLVLRSSATQQKKGVAIMFYAIQLVFNFFWTIIFFKMGLLLFGFVWLMVFWVLIFITMLLFGKISKTAAYLMIPYFVWVTFAAYLNLGIYILN